MDTRIDRTSFKFFKLSLCDIARFEYDVVDVQSMTRTQQHIVMQFHNC